MVVARDVAGRVMTTTSGSTARAGGRARIRQGHAVRRAGRCYRGSGAEGDCRRDSRQGPRVSRASAAGVTSELSRRLRGERPATPPGTASAERRRGGLSVRSCISRTTPSPQVVPIVVSAALALALSITAVVCDTVQTKRALPSSVVTRAMWLNAGWIHHGHVLGSWAEYAARLKLPFRPPSRCLEAALHSAPRRRLPARAHTPHE